jgi:dihydrolipoamide dehydrogenase
MDMISADITLSATGREMSFDGLFAGSLDIAAGDNGIAVNDYGCTNIPHIYAAGDVVANSAQLAHVAMAQGERVSEHIAGLPPKPFPAVVSCIYTSPEIAQAGLTEIEARNQGIAAVTGKYTMSANARTVIITMDRGFMKLVADKSTERIIGAQLMCERASDIIGELALAINARLTIPVLARSLRAHPTFAEGITVAAERLLEKLK